MHVTEADDRDRPGDDDVDLIEVDLAAADGSLALWLRLETRRSAGTTGFLATVLVAGEDPVVVIDQELPLARGAFEYRAPGVWTEFVCETPLEHWTVGLEAFGLRVDPAEVVGPDTYGERVPVGLDLDLETTTAAEGDAASFVVGIAGHGEVLLEDRAWELDAIGQRQRVRSGLRAASMLDSAVAILGEVAVAWPTARGDVPLRRGWVGGNRPGWVDLPQSAE
ncbi:MAG: hypothetical protein AAF548_14205 [Actinomycetota bacterium]